MAKTTMQDFPKRGTLKLQPVPVGLGEYVYQGTFAAIMGDATYAGYLGNLTAARCASGVGVKGIGIVADGSENNNETVTTANGSISGSSQEQSGLSNKEKTVRQIWTEGEFFVNTASGLAQSNVGDILYATDNFTFSISNTAGIPVGRITEYISVTECWFDLNNYQGKTAMRLLQTAAGNTFESFITNSVTSGSVRNVIAESILSGVSISTSLYSIRGVAELSAASTIAGASYLAGVQGKAVIKGTMNHADSRLCAMLAQLDISAGTYTAGQLSALWVDAGATASASAIATKGGGQFNLLRISNTTAANANAVMYIYAEADFLFELGGPGGNADWFATNTTSIEGNNMSYILKIKDPAGGTGYIPVLGAVPS
jgi:hypothetical protein